MSTFHDSKCIAKFRNTNYYAWSYRMEMWLCKLQVWSLVDGTEDHPLGSDNAKAVKAWRIRTDLALSEIVGEVKDRQLVHTCISRDPAVVWARLGSIHLSQGLGSAISTWQKFFQIRKADATSVQEHASQIEFVVNWYNSIPSGTMIETEHRGVIPDPSQNNHYLFSGH